MRKKERDFHNSPPEMSKVQTVIERSPVECNCSSGPLQSKWLVSFPLGLNYFGCSEVCVGFESLRRIVPSSSRLLSIDASELNLAGSHDSQQGSSGRRRLGSFKSKATRDRTSFYLGEWHNRDGCTSSSLSSFDVTITLR